MRNDITTFVQHDSESLYEAWERFKDLKRKCPHHGIPQWMLVQTFYNGLFGGIRTSIDAAAGGALMAKNYDEAYELLETMVANNYQWPSGRLNQPRSAGRIEVDAITALSAQMSTMMKRLDAMGAPNVQNISVICELCAGEHHSDQCSISQESVQFVGSYNRQPNVSNPNSYNPGWRNHPNFSWRDNQAQPQAPRQAYPPGFQTRQQQPSQPEKQVNLEEMLNKFMVGTDTRMQAQDKMMHAQDKMMNQIDVTVKSHSVALRNLENQIGQIVNALNTRPHGALPSDTEVNPMREGNEQCKAVTLRSDKKLKAEAPEKPKDDESKNVENKSDMEKTANEPTVKPKEVQQSTNHPQVSFPQRLQKQKLDKQFSKFLEPCL